VGEEVSERGGMARLCCLVERYVYECRGVFVVYIYLFVI